MEYQAQFRTDVDYEQKYSQRIRAESKAEAIAMLRADAEIDLVELLEVEMHVLH